MSASFLDYKLPCEYQEWQKRPGGHFISILFLASRPSCSSARHKIDRKKGTVFLTAMNAGNGAET